MLQVKVLVSEKRWGQAGHVHGGPEWSTEPEGTQMDDGAGQWSINGNRED